MHARFTAWPLAIAAFLLSTSLAFAAAPVVKITPDKASGVYEKGEKVAWSISIEQDGQPATGEAKYVVKEGGLKEIDQGTLELKEGKASVSASRSGPGTLLLEVTFKPKDDGKNVIGRGGAVFDPAGIKASSPPPDDFDQFWKAKVAELHAVPMNVELKAIDVGDPKVEYYQITLSNIRGAKVYGQLAKPKDKTDLPAILQVQWAGVYPLNRDWVLGSARNGWLAMNIIAHDLPIDEKPEFYQAKQQKELNDYPGQGNDDREQSYFLKMFLSCYRACDYLTTERPDWNGKALVVHGGSQGGYQAIVTAGFHPKVTAFAANVPAGCDHTGKAAGRLPGWPNWAGRTWQGKDEGKMLAAARYFDAMNFATRIKCPALVGLGLVDPVCPPEGIFATINQFQGPKQVIVMPQADHGGNHQAYYAVFGGFLEKQKAGGKP